ncbi:MAG: gamma-glutamyltransferase family protein [Rhodospirillales bacterium]|nr:gamma-glutamyltransferase family protein [Rhodospirillales bacterium]
MLDQTDPYAPRQTLQARRGLVAAGHRLAAQAGFDILEAGGNAVDAGVAGGIALGVLEPEFVSFAGVAPIIIYLAERREVVTISGLGGWPKAITSDYFQRNYGGKIPRGVLRSVVPGAPDAWISALEKYGTMSFADVSRAAIRYAREGFQVTRIKAEILAAEVKAFREWPSSAAVFLRNGEAPKEGDPFVQTDLAKTLQYLADQETAVAKRGRSAGLQAVRDAFYRGDIAKTIVRFVKDSGGLLAAEDLAEFKVGHEAPVKTRFGEFDIYGCGPWCQGPMLLQQFNLLEGINLKAMGHNTPAYIHTLTEAIKIASADREAYFGDPKFIDVPMDRLLSKEYAAERQKMIRPDVAWPAMPAPGNITGATPWRGEPSTRPESERVPADESGRLNTSYVCAMDRHGNAFSATPSDGGSAVPIVPGTGLVLAPRGGMSWGNPDHPSSVAPGKRPRLTTNPAIAIQEGKTVMPFGTPGADVQTQAMVQAFLNIFVFGMDLQEAVEAPRFASYSYPSSQEPHDDHPGLLKLEGRIDRSVGEALAKLGHKVQWWPDRVWLAGSVCAIVGDPRTGLMSGAADNRRSADRVGA